MYINCIVNNALLINNETIMYCYMHIIPWGIIVFLLFIYLLSLLRLDNHLSPIHHIIGNKNLMSFFR